MITVREVAETKTMLVAATPPKVTVGVALKLAPVIVTAVPPAKAPDESATEVTVGAGA